jgi:hypothetical protein
MAFNKLFDLDICSSLSVVLIVDFEMRLADFTISSYFNRARLRLAEIVRERERAEKEKASSSLVFTLLLSACRHRPKLRDAKQSINNNLAFFEKEVKFILWSTGVLRRFVLCVDTV